jgi:hypothetical protein
MRQTPSNARQRSKSKIKETMNNYQLTVNANVNLVATLDSIDALSEHINKVLKRHAGTRLIKFSFVEGESNTLSNVMKRDWKARHWDDEAHKKARTAEMAALKAVFIAENLNDLIEAFYAKFNYQRRWTGADKSGIGTIKFYPEAKQTDKVGTAAQELADAVKAGRTSEALKRLLGDQAHRVVDLQNGDIEVEQLVELVNGPAKEQE